MFVFSLFRYTINFELRDCVKCILRQFRGLPGVNDMRFSLMSAWRLLVGEKRPFEARRQRVVGMQSITRSIISPAPAMVRQLSRHLCTSLCHSAMFPPTAVYTYGIDYPPHLSQSPS